MKGRFKNWMIEQDPDLFSLAGMELPYIEVQYMLQFDCFAPGTVLRRGDGRLYQVAVKRAGKRTWMKQRLEEMGN